MTYSDSNPDVASSDRRSSSRESSPGPVRITIDAQSLSAKLENRSAQGMFVILDDALKVEVVSADGGTEERVLASLTRVAALPGQRSGWGLELIDENAPN